MTMTRFRLAAAAAVAIAAMAAGPAMGLADADPSEIAAQKRLARERTGILREMHGDMVDHCSPAGGAPECANLVLIAEELRRRGMCHDARIGWARCAQKPQGQKRVPIARDETDNLLVMHGDLVDQCAGGRDPAGLARACADLGRVTKTLLGRGMCRHPRLGWELCAADGGPQGPPIAGSVPVSPLGRHGTVVR
jgi:hypothetical protein